MHGGIGVVLCLLSAVGCVASDLHTAARAGDIERVKSLLSAGASASERDDLGGTVLHDAAWSGDVALIEILIGAGAQVDARHTETGSTPLHYAAITNHVEAVAILLDKGAQISAASKTGATALHLAANRGYKEIVELLLGRGAKVDARDDHGGTPLVEAAWKGHAAVVRLLLDKGANVNAATTDTGATALHEAAAKGHDDVVELLLSHKADPALKDRSGSTAPEEALHNRQSRVVGVFMDRGVIGGTNAGASQLKNAVMRGQTDMTAILLDRGVDPNAGFLLHDAALKGFVAVADALIAHGAKVNEVNSSGSMPLHDAALAGKAEMVDFLLSERRGDRCAGPGNGIDRSPSRSLLGSDGGPSCSPQTRRRSRHRQQGWSIPSGGCNCQWPD